MKLIIGLGNPGKQYALTRHNVGFMVIDYLAGQLNIKVEKIKFKSLIGEGNIDQNKIVLAKPQTYMNLSGEAVIEMARWYKVSPEEMLVIYDDMDLPVGRLRLRMHGSAGGHNGMKSIIYLLGTDKFPRLRIGIGRPENKSIETQNFVLGRFNETEAETITGVIQRAAQAVGKIMENGVEHTMNKVNQDTGS